MRIGIVGAHGTGKTTLCKALGSSLSDFRIIHSGTREIGNILGMKLNEPINDIEESFIAMNQMYYLLLYSRYKRVVFDRTTIDATCYCIALNKQGTMGDIVTKGVEYFFKKTYNLIDKYFYLPVEFPNTDDGIRPQGDEYQKLVSKTYLDLFEKYNINYILCKGSVEERVEIIKNNLN